MSELNTKAEFVAAMKGAQAKIENLQEENKSLWEKVEAFQDYMSGLKEKTAKKEAEKEAEKEARKMEDNGSWW